VTVTTDLTVTGKVAQFGRGVLADVSAKLLTQFVDNLEQTVLVDDVIAAPVAETPAAAPVAETPSAAASQEGPTIRKIDQPEPEAINLLEQAGSPVLKRAVPVLGVAIGALIVYGLVRRRRK
jgi:hypothetical protein